MTPISSPSRKWSQAAIPATIAKTTTTVATTVFFLFIPHLPRKHSPV